MLAVGLRRSMHKGNLEALQRSAIFQGYQLEEIEKVCSLCAMTTRDYEVGEMIFLEGQTFLGTGFVLAGEVHIVHENHEGTRTIIEMVQPGSCFAEVINCMGIDRPPVSAYAQKKSSIAFMDIRKFLSPDPEHIDLYSRAASNVMRLLAIKCLRLRSRVEVLSKRSLRGKISAYMMQRLKDQATSRVSGDMPQVVQLGYTREEMSEFLCVNRSALSRELAAMKQAGLIDYSKHEIKILDLKGLELYL